MFGRELVRFAVVLGRELVSSVWKGVSQVLTVLGRELVRI
jgi:hypothetical protein